MVLLMLPVTRFRIELRSSVMRHILRSLLLPWFLSTTFVAFSSVKKRLMGSSDHGSVNKGPRALIELWKDVRAAGE